MRIDLANPTGLVVGQTIYHWCTRCLDVDLGVVQMTIIEIPTRRVAEALQRGSVQRPDGRRVPWCELVSPWWTTANEAVIFCE